jgi:glycosyltransferase involved in cell wall biosynthesis
MKLHILGIPHTRTTPEYSNCAFTGKVMRFSPMMRSVGYEVIHYGNGSENPGASKHEMILSAQELEQYRERLLGNRRTKRSAFIGELSNPEGPIYLEFNKRLRERLENNLAPEDIICCPFGGVHEPAIAEFKNIKVETGIGYSGTYLPYRIYESTAWYQYSAGRAGVPGNNYWFVIPNYFDTSEWDLNLNPSKELVYLGRIQEDKGLTVVTEIAKHRPDLTITICGQGDPTPYLVHPNIKYKEPIHGRERSAYLGGAMCTLMPTIYNEPFGGVAIESHLCGTPVLTTSYGCFTETIKQGFNGYRCHTLGDFLGGIAAIEHGKLDRQAIRTFAANTYDMYVIARQYDEVFRRLSDLYRGGWYCTTSYLR